jgi:hypothetical protein
MRCARLWRSKPARPRGERLNIQFLWELGRMPYSNNQNGFSFNPVKESIGQHQQLTVKQFRVFGYPSTGFGVFFKPTKCFFNTF